MNDMRKCRWHLHDAWLLPIDARALPSDSSQRWRADSQWLVSFLRAPHGSRQCDELQTLYMCSTRWWMEWMTMRLHDFATNWACKQLTCFRRRSRTRLIFSSRRFAAVSSRSLSCSSSRARCCSIKTLFRLISSVWTCWMSVGRW